MEHRSPLQRLVGAYCIVVFRGRGVIDAVVKEVQGETLEQTIDSSEFRVSLQAGDVVDVPGSQLIDIQRDYEYLAC